MRGRVAGLVGLVVTGMVLLPGLQTSGVAKPMTYDHLTKVQKRHLSGFASSEIDALRGTLSHRGASGHLQARPAAGNAPFYVPRSAAGCAYHFGSNVNMDTDCQNVSDATLAGRGQAQNETFLAEDHRRPGSLLGSSNDYRRGDGGCFSYTSTDRGRSFSDTAVPFGFTSGAAYGGAARQYWGAGGDTSTAFDTRGNAYVSCQVFNRGAPVSSNPDLSSALLVFRSTGNAGASYTFPARVVTEQPDVAGTGTQPFLDKQLLTVDDHTSSPFRDRVYVTWTTFAADGSGYIYESHSADYAETWSAPTLVSRTSPMCTDTFGAGTKQGTCNENQDSQPFTAPDGTLYVVWANFNNTVSGEDNRNQILLAKSTDGGASFSDPVKVTDYYDLPDCATYTGQDPGRSCVPDKRDNTSFFRATNYPVGVVDPRHPGRVAVTVGSYINRHSNESNGCVPTGFAASGLDTYDGVRKRGACNNDILVSVSRDAGASFTGTTTDPRRLTSITSTRGQAASSQWFQWSDFTRTGELAVSYYDRQYGSDEVTGSSDFTLSGSSDLAHFASRRVTTSSLPAPTQFEGDFWGDYTGLAAYHGVAHPAWSDTRTPELFGCSTGAAASPSICTQRTADGRVANDQEAFTAAVAVPVP
ncbi:MAG TPA: sialidase family protein [Actinomycetales bacterium]|nr:sialidase family protein [Actinomycetales bacterium]